jgi:ribosomal protein L12E/L44/L45/RPP1/RPP2
VVVIVVTTVVTTAVGVAHETDNVVAAVLAVVIDSAVSAARKDPGWVPAAPDGAPSSGEGEPRESAAAAACNLRAWFMRLDGCRES